MFPHPSPLTPHPSPLTPHAPRLLPIREEQLKERLGERFRELDVPLYCLCPQADPGPRPPPQQQPRRPPQPAQHGLCPARQTAGLRPGHPRPPPTLRTQISIGTDIGYIDKPTGHH